MNAYVLILILFGISVSAFLLGFTPVAWGYLDEILTFDENSLTALFEMFSTYFSNWGNLLLAGVGLVVSGVLLRGNLIALIPFMLLFMMVNLMLLPNNMFLSLGVLGSIIELSFKVVLLVTMISFLRGYP